jgi:hypothetical protein
LLIRAPTSAEFFGWTMAKEDSNEAQDLTMLALMKGWFKTEMVSKWEVHIGVAVALNECTQWMLILLHIKVN